MNFPNIATIQEFDEHFRSDVRLEAARQICRRHNISFDALQRSEHGEHIVFLVDDKSVIKIYRPFRKRLMLLTLLYECSDLRRYAQRLKPEAVDYPLEKLERAIWSFAK